jgi:hypothetical protein
MPRQYFIDTNEQELHSIREALSLLERIEVGLTDKLDVFVYGVTQNPAIIDAAKEAIAKTYYEAEEEIDESDVELAEVAVAIPLSSDILYYLTGSGLKLRAGDFVYRSAEGGGIKSGDFLHSDFKPSVTIHDFSHVGLAESNSSVDQFLNRYGKGQGATIKKNLHRTEEATQPGAPAPQPAPPAPKAQTPAAMPAAPAAAPQPKQTSVHGAVKIRDLVENFLG